jgi:hypothetical protein
MTLSSEWSLGYGYVRLWQQVHRAEEAALVEAPQHVIVAEAMRDVLRLRGSHIENREELIFQIESALEALTDEGTISRAPKAPPPTTDPPPAFRRGESELPRETLRQVRRAINEFRDDRRQGLVRARNQLVRTILVTGVVCYALLALAVLVRTPPQAMIGAISFFLVGAVVGLFNRLYLDASVETATEDYGLSTARLMHTPVLCGIAALGGALIVPMLSAQINPDIAAGVSGQQTIVAPTLESIFDVAQRPFSLVLAAVFGLAPGGLISRLQLEAERYKADLKSSEAPASKK